MKLNQLWMMGLNVLILSSHLAWADDAASMVTPNATPVPVWDRQKLDTMLAQQQYLELSKLIMAYSPPSPNHDPNNAHELQVLDWMRQHANEWHPPILLMLSNKDYDQVVPQTFGNVAQPNAEVAKVRFDEMAQAYGRALTTFELDRADCVAGSPRVQGWFKIFGAVSARPDTLVRMRLGSVYGIGTAALAWVATDSRVSGDALPPPAVWLCGAGNILPDDARRAARNQALTMLKQQLSHIQQIDGGVR